MISSITNYIHSFIDNNNIQATITENRVENSQQHNNNHTNPDTESSTVIATVLNRQIVADNNLKNKIDFERDSIFLTKDDLLPNQHSLHTNNNQIDIEDYEIIYHNQVEENSHNNYEYFPIRYINVIYTKIYNNYYVASFSSFIKDNYDFIFANNYGIDEINSLLDSYSSNTYLDKNTITKLSKLNENYFYTLLISQIISKKPNNFDCIKHISSLYIHVKNNHNNSNDNSKNVKRLLYLLITSLNHAIKEVANTLITEKSINQLTKSLSQDFIEYSEDKITYEDIKDQFIKDAIRPPNINIQLLLEGETVWSDSTEEVQKLNSLIENEKNHIEKYRKGEQLFTLYEENINKLLSHINSDIKEDLISILLTELTQAGAAIHSNIMVSIQQKLCDQILSLPANYSYASIKQYKRINIIKIENGNLIMTISLTMFPGLFIQGPIGDEIIVKQPVNITLDLLLDSQDAKNSKYANIHVSLVKP
jgi:hypothetical protein